MNSHNDGTESQDLHRVKIKINYAMTIKMCSPHPTKAKKWLKMFKPQKLKKRFLTKSK